MSVGNSAAMAAAGNTAAGLLPTAVAAPASGVGQQLQQQKQHQRQDGPRGGMYARRLQMGANNDSRRAASCNCNSSSSTSSVCGATTAAAEAVGRIFELF